MFNNAGNSKQQGDVGLGAAIGWFTSKGYTVCIPLTDSQDYDLVVETKGKLEKVQVKTTSSTKENGNSTVWLKVCGGNRSGIGKIKSFDKNKCDLLFVLTDSGEKYLIPRDLIKVKNQMVLGSKWSMYKV